MADLQTIMIFLTSFLTIRMPFISTSGLIALAIISGIEDISSCLESHRKCLDYFNIKHKGRFKYEIAFSFIMLKTSNLFPFYQTFYRVWMLDFFKSFFFKKKVSIDIHPANIWWIAGAGIKSLPLWQVMVLG